MSDTDMEPTQGTAPELSLEATDEEVIPKKEEEEEMPELLEELTGEYTTEVPSKKEEEAETSQERTTVPELTLEPTDEEVIPKKEEEAETAAELVEEIAKSEELPAKKEEEAEDSQGFDLVEELESTEVEDVVPKKEEETEELVERFEDIVKKEEEMEDYHKKEEEAEYDEPHRKRARTADWDEGAPYEYGDDDMGMGPQETREEMTASQYFDHVLKETKRTKAKPLAPAVRETYARNLRDRMQHAAELDESDTTHGMPALQKLKLLKVVGEAMKKSFLQEEMVKNGVITMIAEWLTPRVEVTRTTKKLVLPAVDLRSTLLDVLLDLPLENEPSKLRIHDEDGWGGVGPHDLESTTIGRRVALLAKHPDETSDNRRKAAILIQKWGRLMTGTSKNYKDLALQEAKRGPINVTAELKTWEDPLEKVAPATPREKLQREERYARRIRRPQQGTMDFHYRPAPKLTSNQVMEHNKRLEGEKRTPRAKVLGKVRDLRREHNRSLAKLNLS